MLAQTRQAASWHKQGWRAGPQLHCYSSLRAVQAAPCVGACSATGCARGQHPAPAFCELAARLSLAKSELGSTVPRKMGLNWFMPALLQGQGHRCSAA